jgi:hypothetical protein
VREWQFQHRDYPLRIQLHRQRVVHLRPSRSSAVEILPFRSSSIPTRDFQKQATALIDDLKGVCANYGLGNDGNEFKIITQIFLYKCSGSLSNRRRM